MNRAWRTRAQATGNATSRPHRRSPAIAIIDATPDMTFDNLVKATFFRLRRMPALRRKVVPVPLSLNHPVLVTQRRLDPKRHFFRHDISANAGGTGTMRDFERVVGEIASTPLKRDVPLWEIHLVEGFADARGGTVVAFSTLVDRDPCRVQLADR